MACLLKPPGGGLGVVTFTTQERDRFVHRDPTLRAAIEALKDRFLVGLHHNWHDNQFRYDPVFDFSMAGEDDLRSIDGRDAPRIPLDACNFCPPEFVPGGDKFWDLLFVGHPVYFKRVPVLFDTVRELYDRGHRLRVLHVCPMPPYSPDEERTVMFDVRERYDALFSDEEQDRFTLLTTDFRYPFPFDLPTLAHIYRSSRVFIHTADEERRCRVAAYAWAVGSPVVGMAPVGSLLSNDTRRPPWFFEVTDDSGYADAVLAALDAQRAGLDAAPAREEVSVEYTVAQLAAHLEALAASTGRSCGDRPISAHGLDIRLGRHHGIGHNRNSVPQTVSDFVRYLAQRGDDAIARDAQERDPEVAIAALPEWRSSEEDVAAGAEIDLDPGPARRLARRVAAKARLTLTRQ